MDDTMLEIHELHACVGQEPILRGVNLSIAPGEVHILMGPNGSGKSTLLSALAGRDPVEITGGSVAFGGQDLLALSVEERARTGLFLSMQEPVELPGVQMAQFFLECERALQPDRNVDALQSIKRVREAARSVGLPDDVLRRDVHVGFSGGEKKRLEMMQMEVFQPKCLLLDEIDSGLDVDAFQGFAKRLAEMRQPDRSFLLVSHYHRLTERLSADRVHVMSGGRIVASGGMELGAAIERDGYAELQDG